MPLHRAKPQLPKLNTQPNQLPELNKARTQKTLLPKKRQNPPLKRKQHGGMTRSLIGSLSSPTGKEPSKKKRLLSLGMRVIMDIQMAGAKKIHTKPNAENSCVENGKSFCVATAKSSVTRSVTIIHLAKVLGAKLQATATRILILVGVVSSRTVTLMRATLAKALRVLRAVVLSTVMLVVYTVKVDQKIHNALSISKQALFLLPS